MFRLWGKIITNGKIKKDIVIINEDVLLNRTAKIFKALEEICYEIDLSKPIWLDSSVREFSKHSKVKFTKDSFIEVIDFDHLEIQVIEE